MDALTLCWLVVASGLALASLAVCVSLTVTALRVALVDLAFQYMVYMLINVHRQQVPDIGGKTFTWI